MHSPKILSAIQQFSHLKSQSVTCEHMTTNILWIISCQLLALEYE